ncbi:MAG: zinc ribbon domain-containing protein [Chloroflexota bacterium]|nr:zinc ribbon domain-containing protein [Chloroflexota bacterium]
MPLYEFHCPDCGARFEKLVRPVPASADVACPSCGHVPVTRLFSTFARVGGSSCAPQPGGG